jgi:hypothetical protein
MLNIPELRKLNDDWQATPPANSSPYSPKGNFILVVYTKGKGETYKGACGPYVHDRAAVGDGWEDFQEAQAAAKQLQQTVGFDTQVTVDTRIPY